MGSTPEEDQPLRYSFPPKAGEGRTSDASAGTLPTNAATIGPEEFDLALVGHKSINPEVDARRQELGSVITNWTNSQEDRQNFRVPLLALAMVESSFGTILQNPKTSASGPFQFIDQTMFDMLRDYVSEENFDKYIFKDTNVPKGKRSKSWAVIRKGMNDAEKAALSRNITEFSMNPQVSVHMAAALITDSIRNWESTYGVSNSLAGIAAHHQGPKNLKALYKRYNVNPDQPPHTLVQRMRPDEKNLSETEKEFIGWWDRYVASMKHIESYESQGERVMARG